MDKQRRKHVVWSWDTGALCCFAGGIGAALLGCILTAATWVFSAAQHPRLHALGTALLIVTIPLLIFAGYCMDWAELNQKKAADSARRESLPN